MAWRVVELCALGHAAWGGIGVAQGVDVLRRETEKMASVGHPAILGGGGHLSLRVFVLGIFSSGGLFIGHGYVGAGVYNLPPAGIAAIVGGIPGGVWINGVRLHIALFALGLGRGGMPCGDTFATCRESVTGGGLHMARHSGEGSGCTAVYLLPILNPLALNFNGAFHRGEKNRRGLHDFAESAPEQ